MADHDPASAPRHREAGYKGDAWTVTVPPDGDAPIALLDTGADSICIVRIPDGAWDRAAAPVGVHTHARYDETILLTRGSGTLTHGPDPEHLRATRVAAPAVIQVPPGCWHHLAMDPGVRADATALFTVHGTVIEPFAVQMAIIDRGRVPFAALPVVHPRPVHARSTAREASAPVGSSARVVPAEPASSPPAEARISGYPAPNAEGLTLPLDTGQDSLFLMASAAGPERRPSGGPPVELPAPEFVDVHRHPDVDEFIIRRHGAGYILNGPTPETITLTPFRGPCVLVMPAGAFHRIVQTEEDEVGESILGYSDRRAIVEPYATIIARTATAAPGPIISEG